jgi:peptide methionine sulfoxide reductase msrA/msrB
MLQEIVFAAGCFWGVEKFFANTHGVVDVVSGYTAGSYENPTYDLVLKYRNTKDITNHTEAVHITYDVSQITTEHLIKEFWQLHDPTQGNRQGNDIGNNYRSGIYWTTKEQENIALKTKKTYQKLLNNAGFGTITTEIQTLNKFYPAEEYHQDYLAKNPDGYCPNHATGVKFSETKESKYPTTTAIIGKEILVIKDEFCPYCDKFKTDVGDNYQGDIILRYGYKNNLKGYDIHTKLDVSPIILFIENGKEIYAHKGYLSPKEFYLALGLFKLGKRSEAYNVAFNQGTDNRFCKQYDLFKDTPEGYFIDKLSGEKLFDTKDRFNSGSGWLSFSKAIGDSVIEKVDNSYGMQRIEVIAKTSGVHLGHVFDGEYADGRRRYCINATVLDFVAK